jgi:thiol:disulfide interchange protein DsbA
MKKLLTVWLLALGMALSVFALPIQAQQLGGDYTEIVPALAADAPDKIEVIEFFSYACPHCNDLNPPLNQWSAKLPGDVAFRKVAVGFNTPFYQLMAKLFYSLDAMGESKRLDEAVFKAIHSQGVKLIDEKSVTAWVATQGIDGKKFGDAFGSFGVLNQVKRSDMLVQKAKIQGVPALLVDGRYLVGGPNIKSNADLLAISDKLVAKVRAERAAKK